MSYLKGILKAFGCEDMFTTSNQQGCFLAKTIQDVESFARLEDNVPTGSEEGGFRGTRIYYSQ